MKYKIIITLIYLSQISFSQTAIGDWRIFSPYNGAEELIKTDNFIYCITQSGLYRYNINDNSVEGISRITGLSDVNITCGEYYDGNLILAYENGNIDILSNNNIYNIPYIKRKDLYGSKRINNVLIYNDFAYLSCGFGIVKVDIHRHEIKDTYLIGNNSTQKEIYDLTVNNGYFYAATEDGIYKADVNAQNLAFYENWHHITDILNANSKFDFVESFNNKTYAVSNNKIYTYTDNSWQNLFPDTFQTIYNITAQQNYLLLAANDALNVYDENNQFIKQINQYNYSWGNTTTHIRKALINNGIYYIADYYSGLIKHNDNIDNAIKPDGPKLNTFYNMDIVDGKLYGVQGGVTGVWSPQSKSAYAMIFEDNKWTNIKVNAANITDLCNVQIDPENSSRVYISSYKGGVVQMTGSKVDTIYRNFDPPYAEYPDWVWAYGLDFDENNNLWLSIRGVNNQFYVKTPDNKWHALNYNKEETGVDWIGPILATKTGTKWVILPRVGMFAFNDNGTFNTKTDDKYRKFSTRDENGDVVSSQNLCFAEDKDGTIWVGTDKGVVTYFYPERVFVDEVFKGQRVIIEQNGVAQYLLSTEEVTAVAVDGANNKWFGTKSGVYKINNDGTEELLHFTVDNSPLPSNNILSIKIDDNSGEVFIGTDQGLISYKSTATEGGEFYEDVYAYPNPVPHDYNGPIAIKGLIKDADVKITDIAGNLVYEVKAEGGQAIWDGKNFNGERVKTGVYLAFCSDESGEKTFVTKILFIN